MTLSEHSEEWGAKTDNFLPTLPEAPSRRWEGEATRTGRVWNMDMGGENHFPGGVFFPLLLCGGGAELSKAAKRRG